MIDQLPKVIIANCRFEGTKILVPFLLENLVLANDPYHKGFIWEGQIDTGFSGYLMMPFKDAMQNGLELQGFGNWGLADGATVMNTIDTLGKLTIVGRSGIFGVVSSPIATPNCGILIGQKMLEAWNVKLEADPVNKIAQLIAVPPKQVS